ncbi:MAG: hypothetical protein IK109_07810 [Clostridiales bacterium]|nr:hypothetical protein [Clostridiales bacterium]
MRLFFYYTWHSFVNTIKKVLKTWVAIMLACLLLGGLIGLGIGVLLPDSDDKEEDKTNITTVVGEDGEEADVSDPADAEATAEKKDKTPGFVKERGKAMVDLVDLCISAVFFLSLAMNISSANRSGKIFKPADVPMLFASPMKPQSVLMFRLIGTLAMSLLLSVYMLFQLPNLIYNLGLGTWGAFSLIIAYGLGLFFGTLVQVAFYTFMSRTKKGTKGLSTYVIIAYAVIAGAFGAYVMTTGKDTLSAAFDFFGGKKTFWVPFWGWMRGFCYYAITGENALSILFLTLFIFACALIVVMIWKVKADFYEDAMFETEKVAAILDGAKSSSKGGVMVRQKERKGKIDREGFHHGSGANVFLHKAIFNRLRFSRFKIFSKTLIVFTISAAAAAWIVGRADISGVDPFIVPACALTFLMFYRTLGNPLLEDTKREFFVLIPESPLKKIWYSLLGSIAVNAIDLLLPVVVAAIMLGTSPLVAIGWYLFILSVSLFGTTVGAFIDVSVPGEVGSTLKTVVQIMLLYFGLLPAAVFIVLGVVFHVPALMLVIGSIFNVGLGALFTLMTPHFLVNR